MATDSSRPRKRDLVRGLFQHPTRPPSGPSSFPARLSRGNEPATTTAAPPVDAAAALRLSPQDPSLPLRQRMLDKALRQLAPNEQKVFKNDITAADERDVGVALQKAYNAAFKKQQECKQKNWQWQFRGRTIIVRDEADKVLFWLKRFKTIGGAVAEIDPVHIGLPWAVISSLLDLALADQEQVASLLAGMANALYLSQRLRPYADYLESVGDDAPSAVNLEATLVDLYSHVLRFLGMAYHAYCRRIDSFAKEVLQSFWKKSELADFEVRGEKLTLRAQQDADMCAREMDGLSRSESRTWKAELDDKLQNLDALRASLDDLTTKTDLARLVRAEGAIHGSHEDEHLASCMEGTRTELIAELDHWLGDPDSKRTFWLCGMAGTGKSALSRTFAAKLIARQSAGECLVATFFFKRGAGDRANAGRLFPTMASQLADLDPTMRTLVAKAMAAQPGLSEASLSEQFQKLLVGPLEGMANSLLAPLTIILVIDALDECNSEDDVKTIVPLLMLLTQRDDTDSLTVRVYITSRPEADTITSDISLYLERCFADIRDSNALSRDWPGKDKMDILIRAASPLFIFAATLTRFVAGCDAEGRSVLGGHPRQRLEIFLGRSKDSAIDGLDMMYEIVLNQIIPSTGTLGYDEALIEFQQLLGPIVLLQDPLPLAPLCTLLDLEPDEAFWTLQRLQSVLRISSSISDPSPIRPLHASFADYVLRNDDSSKVFHADRSRTHSALAQKCLRRMQQNNLASILKRDICSVRDQGVRRTAIDKELIHKYISSDLAYSCQYWVHHTLESGSMELLIDDGEAHRFLQSHFLHWLETMSWLGRLSEVIGYIEDLRLLLEKSERISSLLSFLNDASRFVRKNRYVIDLAPLQLYSSALYFTPLNSIVRQTFRKDLEPLEKDFSVLPEVHLNWSAEVQKLEGHTHDVNTIAVSPFGRTIASGSRDSDIRLWSFPEGELLQSIDGKGNAIEGLAFSPADPTVLASACSDKSVRLWETRTGQEIQRFDGHEERASSVAFSPDGQILASSSADKTIRLWCLRTAQCVQVFKGHDDWVTMVVYSPDGGCIASASKDHTVRLWDVETALETQRYTGHTSGVNAIAFSPHDLTLAASGSDDKTAHVWNVSTGKTVQVFDYGNAVLCSVAFHPTWTSVLVAAGGRGAIVFWDILTRAQIWTCVPTVMTTCAFAFLPTNMDMLVSASSDMTVSLWDTKVQETEQQLPGHSMLVHEVVASADGTRVVSASFDGGVALWDSSTGTLLGSYGTGGVQVTTVAFLPEDINIIAIGRSDGVVALIDIRHGQELKNFDGHIDASFRVAFSPDSKLLASISETRLCVWDIETGRSIECSEAPDLEDYGTYSDLCFSPDGKVLVVASHELRFLDPQTGELLGAQQPDVLWLTLQDSGAIQAAQIQP
ncbi:hypothetical protein ANO11243_094560 [Dothideomycetidae sp. 11243]|nr:hypothetical protein ANO11243_094560 [fungal sp. No.11243]